MNKKISKSWWLNPWVVGIGCTLLSIIFSSIKTSVSQNINLFFAFGKVFLIILNFFNFRIPIWSIIVVFVVLLFIHFILNQIKELMKEQQKSEWRNYKMDIFNDKLFAWEYESSPSGYLIENLHQMCKECKCGLVKTSLWKKPNHINEADISSLMQIPPEVKFKCPNCNSIYGDVSHIELKEIEELIKYRISKGEYKDNPYFPLH